MPACPDCIPISVMIAHLQSMKRKYGDLPLVYASDDEGNSYHELRYTPQAGVFNAKSNEFDPVEEGGKPNALLIN